MSAKILLSFLFVGSILNINVQAFRFEPILDMSSILLSGINAIPNKPLRNSIFGVPSQSGVESSFFYTFWFELTVIFVVSLIVAYVIRTRARNAIEAEQEKGRQSRIIAELELKALRAQMNPHFIFNSLNSIQDFVLNNEGEQAAKYLSKFARLIRMILDISEQTHIDIESNIAFLKLYMDLEGLRLSNSFQYEFIVDPDIDPELNIPTLLIQPHIENAIWHGLQYKTGPKLLSIHFSKLEENLIGVDIEDNGVGRTFSMAVNKSNSRHYESKGTRIAEDRMNLMNKFLGFNIKCEVVDLFDKNNYACGTKVILKIPVSND